MKEIKFRAKRLDNGEWVYGYYALLPHPLTGFLKSFMVVSSYDEKEECGLQDFVSIDKNTLGQYTGEKDKNGKDIYEGDIVKVAYKERRKDWGGEDKWNYWDNIENIVFINGGFMFHTVVFDTDMYRPMIPMFNNCELNVIEVIGNIHENKGE